MLNDNDDPNRKTSKKLRDLIMSLGPTESAEKQEYMENHPLYQAGFDDGYDKATREYQATLRHIIAAVS